MIILKRWEILYASDIMTKILYVDAEKWLQETSFGS